MTEKLTDEQETELDKEFIDEFHKLCAKYNRQLYPAIQSTIQLQRVIKPNDNSQPIPDGVKKPDISEPSK